MSVTSVRQGLGVGLLVAIVGARVGVAQPAGKGFHTSPECWSAPRIYHAGTTPAELGTRIRVIDTPTTAPAPGQPTASPNGAYRLWVRNPDTNKSGPWSAGLIVDVERPERPTLLFDDIAQPIAPTWVNEKLVFVRVAWGRTAFSDIIFDVETRKIIYNEQARDGQAAFEQFREACGGRCPCGATDPTGGHLPASKPANGVLIGLLMLPTIFGPGETGGSVAAPQPKPVTVHAMPDESSAVMTRPIKPDDVEHREIAYEQAAAVVYEQRMSWYRIGLAVGVGGKRSGWVKADDAGAYTPLQELLVGRLAYLTEHWDGELRESPEADATVERSPLKRAEGRQEYSASVSETRLIDGGLWLKIALHESDPCEGGEPKIAAEGWVPAYSDDGQLTAWYHSRGC